MKDNADVSEYKIHNVESPNGIGHEWTPKVEKIRNINTKLNDKKKK